MHPNGFEGTVWDVPGHSRSDLEVTTQVILEQRSYLSLDSAINESITLVKQSC